MPSANDFAGDGSSVAHGTSDVSWTTPENVGTLAAGGLFAQAVPHSGDAVDWGIYITLDGTNTSGSNLSNGDTWQTDTPESWTYGGATELWGRSWSLSDIKGNASFGILIAVQGSGDPTEYLCAFDFDFSSIPNGSTIDGVKFDLKRMLNASGYPSVNDLNCTVYYTEGGGGSATAFLPAIAGLGW